jgi:hypothetical protein
MNRTKCGISFLLLAAALGMTSPCRADLFALISSSRQVLRIDTVTGNVTDTIEIPNWITGSQPSSLGLAYDGRSILTLNVRQGGYDEAWRYDLALGDFWMPSGVLQYLGPDDFTPATTGMGMRPDPSIGGQLLIAVSQRTDTAPSYIQQFLAPFVPLPPDPFLPLASAVPLPSNFSAQGADFDPSNNEFWVSGDDIGVTTIHQLVRVDIDTGAILQTLTPVTSATPIRGVGFDNGAMFIGVRNPPILANGIAEIDRVTGAILRTIPLPTTAVIAGLAGGPVIPEPGSAVLAALGLVGAMTIGRARACSSGRKV